VLNPLIQGVEINDAGHWVHTDQPQVFTDVLKDFVGVGKRP
jgi:esterase